MNWFVPEAGNISIMASGGADSTLLAFYFAKYYADRHPRLFLIGATEENTVRLHRICGKIHDLTKYQYPVTTFKEKTFIRPTVEKILGVLGGAVYTGCNKVETQAFTPTVYIEGDTPPVRGPALNEFHIRPFIDWTKIQILRKYKEHGILDLLYMTRSCGLATGVCGGCYFCMERSWACATLDIPNLQDK